MAVTVPVEDAADIHAAMGDLVPGDTLLMLNGNWIDQYISLHAVGTEADPIVLMAETPGQVVLTGQSRLAFSGEYIEINGLNFYEGYSTGAGVIEFRRYGVRANHCRLTNSTIYNYNPTSIGVNYKWVSVFGRNNQIDHCYFAGKNHDGATFVVWLSEEQDRDNHHIIEYNYFGKRPELGFNGGETIRIGTSTYSLTDSRTIVRHNLFEECDGEIEIISNKSCENVYFNNTFRNNAGTLTLRHGERALVEGNFFLGEGKPEAGGIRIIDSDHVIINNYFENLFDDGYRAAISFTMGVENSPLNRYLQVDSVLVAFNTLVNCKESFMMGVGSSDDQTLPPTNCTIANNAVYAKNYPVFHTDEVEGLPQNFSFKQNMVMGTSLGIPDTSAGIIWQDPQFDLTGELARPLAGSPLIGQAYDIPYIVATDMDGQARVGAKDIGADQVSADPIIYRPLFIEDVGPAWSFQPPDNQLVEGGVNTLVNAVQNLIPGDTLFLVGTDYEFSEPIIIDQDVLIMPGPNMGPVPIILRPAESVTGLSVLFDVRGGSKLRLSGVHIDGGGQTGNTIQRIFHVNASNEGLRYSLDLHGVKFKNIGKAGDYAMLLDVEESSVADSITFRDCQVSQVNGTLFNLDKTADDSGDYNAKSVILEDCTFWDVSQSVLSVYGGDDVPFTAGPVVLINHCTFHEVGSSAYPVINARDVDVTTIQNSIFSSSSTGGNIVELYSWSQIMYTDVYESGALGLHEPANSGEGMLALDPGFTNALIGDFTLTENSELYAYPGSEGEIYGDRNWLDPRFVSITEVEQPKTFRPLKNYPNPFNGSTALQFTLEADAQLSIMILDLRGRPVQELPVKRYTAGQHEVSIDLGGLSSGVYLCRIDGTSYEMMTKLMVIK